jgi:hypothetical protein
MSQSHESGKRLRLPCSRRRCNRPFYWGRIAAILLTFHFPDRESSIQSTRAQRNRDMRGRQPKVGTGASVGAARRQRRSATARGMRRREIERQPRALGAFRASTQRDCIGAALLTGWSREAAAAQLPSFRRWAMPPGQNAARLPGIAGCLAGPAPGAILWCDYRLT